VPNLGLLFDVDGPLASPLTRSVIIPSILRDLVKLAGAGVPIAFITGRSDVFIADELVAPLVAKGLADALERGGSGMFGVFEKGGAWAPITPDGMGEVVVDASVAIPVATVDALRDLVQNDYPDVVFFDETKRAMVSVEQRKEVSPATFHAAQARFDDAAFDIMAAHGLGIRHGDRVHTDSAGNVPFRIDPTIISTDIESVLLDKDRGAERALAYLGGFAELPRRWRTVGDSRSDYKMADHLHSAGYDVAHVDVRPSDGILDRGYPVITIGDEIHDDAGAALLAHWVRELGIR
jgi:hypothetical protein